MQLYVAFSTLLRWTPGFEHKGPPTRGGPEVFSMLWTTQWNESPQAHEPVALGLSMVNPCFWMVSSKSIVAPSR